MARYLQRRDIEDVFGISNVTVWADLDGKEIEADIEARIERALNYGERHVEDRFRNSAYVVPFVESEPNALDTVKHQMARLAGWWLYTSRGLRDNEQTSDKMQIHVDEATDTIDRYLSGQMVMNVKRNNYTTPAPTVVTPCVLRDSQSRSRTR